MATDALPPDAQRSFDAARGRLAQGDARTALSHALVVTQRFPGFAPAWQVTGIAALHTGDLRLALEALQRAAKLSPDEGDVFANLAAAWLRSGRFAEAESAARRAHQLIPERAGPLLNLGTACQALGRLDDAVRAVEQALGLDRERPEAWNNMGNLYKEQGELVKAIAAYETALALEPNLREAFSNQLAALKLVPETSPEALLQAHLAYARRYECPALANYRPPARDSNPARRLRIGYVSPDCHTAVPAFIRPVLRQHDPEQFEVFCYFNNPQKPEPDPNIAARVQARIMSGHSDEAVAAQVRADEIDILIDIAGHTGKNRLGVFMERPAPIQITWLDYLGTTGLASMDYRISDTVADPPGTEAASHREALLRLPHAQWCWEAPADAPPVAALPAAQGKPFTFGSFNNYPKLTDATLALWSKLLATCPNSRLLVVGAAAGAAQARVRRALNVAPERLGFAPRVDAVRYRQLFAEVDLALDPWPFSGATTTLDALWQGVPVLTWPGETSASRSSASILSALKLVQFIASDETNYLAIAKRHAESPNQLAELRLALRPRLAASSLMDAAAFTRDLENLYRGVWGAWCGTAEHSSARVWPVSRWRETDRRFSEALAHLAARRWEQGIPELAAVLKAQPNWRLGQQYYASAVLAWAKEHPECLAPLRPAVPEPIPKHKLSIVVCSIDEGKLAQVSASFAERFAGWPHEFIAIRDAQSLAEGFNRGAGQATGEVLIFAHDDIRLISPDFAARLAHHLEHYDGVGVCGTDRLVSARWDAAGWPHLQGQFVQARPGESGLLLFVAGCAQAVMENAQGLDGVFVAVHRHVWEALRYDEDVFDGFHLYDLDFSWRAFESGFRLAVPLDLELLHQSKSNYGQAWWRYAQRFEAKYAASFAPPPKICSGYLQAGLKDIEEARLLLAGLRHYSFGQA